jgi:NitT/TauT family transport system permease protein
MRRRLVPLTQLALIVTALLLYELATRLELLDPLTFVPLSTMVETLVTDLRGGDYVTENLLPTALEIGATFVAAAVIGVTGGVLLWWSDYLHHVLQPYLLLVYAIPTFAFYPVLVSMVGAGPTSVVITAALGAVPVVVINTAIGFRETREVLVKVGRAFCPRRSQIVRHVYFPAAWPHVFTGLRLAVAYSIIIVIATEFILSTRGMGHSIAFAYNNFDLPHMYASILLVILIALVATGSLSYVETRVHRRAEM